MNHYRKNFVLSTPANLLGTNAACSNRIDGFEVTWIGNQMQVDCAAVASGERARRALVILHIAAAEYAARVDIFKLCEHVGRGFADRVDHHVEASAMAHRDHNLNRAAFSSLIQDFVQKRDQRSNAFEREAFGSEITRLDYMFEQVRSGEQLEDVLLVHRRSIGFEALLNPLSPCRIGNVHELGANRAAVTATRFVGEITLNIEFGNCLWLKILPERIELGLKIPPAPEGFEDPLPVVRINEEGTAWNLLTGGSHN